MVNLLAYYTIISRYILSIRLLFLIMKIAIKRFDKSIPLPEFKTKGAAGLDLAARVEMLIAPHSIAYIPLNIALQFPAGHWALLAARSSLHKKGLQLVNGIGVGDSDYCGDGDEYRAAVLNFTDQEVKVEKGERVAQLIMMKTVAVELVEKDQFGTPDRGGFGSTGK